MPVGEAGVDAVARDRPGRRRGRCSRSESRARGRACRPSPPRPRAGTARRARAWRPRRRRRGRARGCASRRSSRRRPRPAGRSGSRTRRARRASRWSPLALAPKRKFSPIETWVAPSFAIRMSSMNSSAGICENSLSNGITTSSETPRPAITSRFAVEAHDQLRRGLGVDDLHRVRLEGEDGVGALDHLAMADVNAVEGADRDLARPRLRVGELGHLHRHAPGTFAARRLRRAQAPRQAAIGWRSGGLLGA